MIYNNYKLHKEQVKMNKSESKRQRNKKYVNL